MNVQRVEEIDTLLEILKMSGDDPYQSLINYSLGGLEKYINYINEVKKISIGDLSCFGRYTDAFIILRSKHVSFHKDKYVKLYIPLDDLHIVEGSKRLFSFIVQKEIIHESKISTVIGTDDIVVRTPSLDGAKRIIDFVDNNTFLQEGLLKKNPFLIECGSIGGAMDGTLSFNEELSYYIREYIKDVKKDASYTSAVDFKRYLDNFYDKNVGDSSFINYYLDNKIFRYSNDPYLDLANKLEICEIIKNNLLSSYSLVDCYSDMMNKDRKNERYQKVKNLLRTNVG